MTIKNKQKITIYWKMIRSPILRFSPNWDFKPIIEIFNQNEINETTTDKNQIKSDLMNKSKLNGIRQTFAYSSVLDMPPEFKAISQPGKRHCKQKNKSVLKVLTFFLEVDDRHIVEFPGETLTFTFLIRIFVPTH